ncbi:uncharacterized protein LOC142985411 [Anticarsia gemmatalis]|uniref:uncharacterized protein LOC142985411 n=1 Tax=Anticarsia gemmatalis TaxID=129554 RepID=UPI003F773D00
MRWSFLTFLFYFFIQCKANLWTKGVVHYAINKKDYDVNSQDIIMTTFEKIQKELCVKFFNTPLNYTATQQDKILYINNVDKIKNCPPQRYNFNGTVVDMSIGYKCLNERDITRIVVEMLKASITPQVSPLNSFDLLQKFRDQVYNITHTGLLQPEDRNYINTNYHAECIRLLQQPLSVKRRTEVMEVNKENEEFYKDKLWPLGVIMYGVNWPGAPDFVLIRQAMTMIELASCVVFQEMDLNDEVLIPKSYIWFDHDAGERMPAFGFVESNQTVHLRSMARGAPGHTAHRLNMLLRIMGIPMTSNRYDRDLYVRVDWKNVEKGMEHYLERMPPAALLKNSDGEFVSYDYMSASHAPVNYMCRDCSLGQQTVIPLQDHLWQRSLSIGHRNDLSESDIEIIDLLYSKECLKRAQA